MNRCDYCLENLSSYLDKEMSENEMKEIEEHLKECNSCSYEFDVLKTIVSTCSELEEELPDGFSSSLHTRLEKAREDMLAKRNRTGKVKLFSQIAAGFLIVITLGFAIRVGYFGNRFMVQDSATSDAAPMAGRAPATTQSSAPKKFGLKGIKSEQNESAMEGEDTKNSFAIAQSAEIQNQADDSSDKLKQKDSDIKLSFNEHIVKDSGEEEYDTEVTIVVDDIDKAIDLIMAIDEKIGKSSENNMSYNQDSINVYRGSCTRKNSVELKLVYINEKTQQSFLEEIQLAFSNIQVESVPSEDEKEDEQEYIKIIIEKKK